MNRRQKLLLANISKVLFVTFLFVVLMVHAKDAINRSEAIRAMKIIGANVFEYRENYRALPPEEFIEKIIDRMELVRITNVKYRAQWIGFRAEPETIVAYSYKDYSWFIGNGYVVLQLNGEVKWIKKEPLEQMLKSQQSQAEIEWLKKELDDKKYYMN